MTTLKDVNFGLNTFCGPAVLSVLTGESTDRCAAVISSVSGRKEIKAVNRAHLKEAFKRLKFDVETTAHSGSSLYGVLYRMHRQNGLYVVFVPHHVVAVEVAGDDIFICDNHSKTPLDIRQSARLLQKVEEVWKVFPHPLPKLVREEIKIIKYLYGLDVRRYDYYENNEDNAHVSLGSLKFKDDQELLQIIKQLKDGDW